MASELINFYGLFPSHVQKFGPILEVARYKPLACWDYGFESPRMCGCLSLVLCVVTQRFLGPPDHSSRRVLLIVCVSDCNLETSTIRRPMPIRVVEL